MKHVDMRSLAPAAQEERRRQAIGLRERGLTHPEIARQVGLTKNGVFDICKRYRKKGMAGLRTGPRGPEPGTGRFVTAAQEAEIRALIRRGTPDAYGLPFALWSRAAVAALVERRCGGVRLAVRTMGTTCGAGASRRRSRCGAPTSSGPRRCGTGWRRTTPPSRRAPGGRRA